MSCEDRQLQISSFIDGELSDEEVKDLKIHLEACPTCSEIYQSFCNFSQLYQKPEQNYKDISHQVMQQLPIKPIFLRWQAAACIFILGILIGGFFGHSYQTPSSEVAKERYPYLVKIKQPAGYLRIENEEDEKKLHKFIQRIIANEEKKRSLNRYSVDSIPAQFIDYDDF